jgi:hypothetical protein
MHTQLLDTRECRYVHFFWTWLNEGMCQGVGCLEVLSSVVSHPIWEADCRTDLGISFEVMLPSACRFIVDGLTFSCRCSTLHVSAYMADRQQGKARKQTRTQESGN